MTKWDTFRTESLNALLKPGSRVIDIGGGLRVLKGKGNRYDAHMDRLFGGALEQLTYQIVDPVPDYEPDIVGDIHNLPLADNSVDGVICIAVLEHVEDPIRAMSEMLRVVKPGCSVYLFVPFLYYYHAEVGYYGDYWRFTKDTLPLLAKGFSSAQWVSVRGAIETWVRLSPLGTISFFTHIARYLDVVSGKVSSNQVSGYIGLLVK